MEDPYSSIQCNGYAHPSIVQHRISSIIMLRNTDVIFNKREFIIINIFISYSEDRIGEIFTQECCGYAYISLFKLGNVFEDVLSYHPHHFKP